MSGRCSKCGAQTNDIGDVHCRKIFVSEVNENLAAGDLERAKALYFAALFDEKWKEEFLARKGEALNVLIREERQEAVRQANREKKIAETNERHQEHLVSLGITSKGATLAPSTREHRTTWCYLCRENLNNAIDLECNICGWIICCRDGACGCGYRKDVSVAVL